MTRYRKSWTQALLEIRSNVPEKEEADYHQGHEPQGGHDHYEDIEESAALQLKMAFDDTKIKIKGVKGGKLVISKKDEKKVEKIIAGQMKDKKAAQRVLGSQIIFEEIELVEKEVAVPSSIENLNRLSRINKTQSLCLKMERLGLTFSLHLHWFKFTMHLNQPLKRSLRI